MARGIDARDAVTPRRRVVLRVAEHAVLVVVARRAPPRVVGDVRTLPLERKLALVVVGDVLDERERHGQRRRC